MAKGESSFNTGEVTKKKYNFNPFKAGDYELKLLAETVENRKAEVTKKRPNPMPYISLAFEALGTGEDGGKNKRVYHMLFCSLKPDKNGVQMPVRADQIKGLADALNSHPNLPSITVNGIECVSPLAVKKWLEKHDGEVVKAHVKVQKGTDEYPNPKNAIDEFFEPEEEGGEGEEAEGEEDESDEEGEEGEESDEEGDEGEEEGEEEADEEDELEKAAKKPSGKKLIKKKGKK